MQNICVLLYCHPWLVLLLPYFFSVLSPKRHDFREKLLNMKGVFSSSVLILFEKFLMLRRIQHDVAINVRRPSGKVQVILVRFESKLNFLDRFCKNSHILNFIIFFFSRKRAVPCGLRDGRMDLYDKTDDFRNFAKVPITMH
jgi:hypothetical protein